jgi:hypothetical protein
MSLTSQSNHSACGIPVLRHGLDPVLICRFSVPVIVIIFTIIVSAEKREIRTLVAIFRSLDCLHLSKMGRCPDSQRLCHDVCIVSEFFLFRVLDHNCSLKCHLEHSVFRHVILIGKYFRFGVHNEVRCRILPLDIP